MECSNIIINYLGDKLGNGGIESFLTNICSGLVENGFRFIIVANYREGSIYEEQLKNSGAEIIYLAKKNIHCIAKIRAFVKLVNRYSDSIIHFHASNSGLLLYAFFVRITGSNSIVYHIHSTEVPIYSLCKKIRLAIVKLLFIKIPRVNVACSGKAGKEFYNKRFYCVIHNGIELERFRFNIHQRERIRSLYGCGSKLVIAQIGRFHTQKNHVYSLGLIKDLLATKKDVLFLVVGDGEELPRIKALIDEYSLHNNVLILPPMREIEGIYNASDILLLPSIWEGFGMVAIEAQASGLPIICSESVVDDVFITDFIYRVNLSDNQSWIDRIKDIDKNCVNRFETSKQGMRECLKAGYSSTVSTQELLNIYNDIRDGIYCK